VKQLLFDPPAFPRFQIQWLHRRRNDHTPFDLCVQNLASRYHMLMQAVRAVADFNSNVEANAVDSRYEEKPAEHHAYIRTHEKICRGS
jgi:phosphoketolase